MDHRSEQGEGKQENVHEQMGHGNAGAGRGHGEHGEMAMGPAVAPEEAGIAVEMRVTPGSPVPARPVELGYRVSDVESGEAITGLPVNHERQMHLISVSKDLEDFQHIHPKPGPGGDFAVTTEFSEEGDYVLYDEFEYEGQTVLDRRELAVGDGGGEASLSPDMKPKTVGGLTVSLDAPGRIRAGEEVAFTYTVEKDGLPADDLEPYLGAAAHVAIVSEDTRKFVHTHGEDVASGGKTAGDHGHGGGHGDHGEGQTFGPRIAFTHTFQEPGLYKIWAQFDYHGDIATVPFVVEVE
jgi:P-type Cu+ transporter